MSGVAELWTMSAFPMFRVDFTAMTCLSRPYLSLTPAPAAAAETKLTQLGPTALPKLPNMGRINTGCGVGIEALGSPICAHAIVPPFMTNSGFAPNIAGVQRHMSASFPTSMEPITWLMPCATAGLMVYLAMYRLMRVLSLPVPLSSGKGPRCCRIFAAVCHVRVTTSPTRPMACESEDMMEMAPRSCRMSSAAMVSPRMRDSAKATSSGMSLLRW
mmetsp:Transcript_125600/g.349746  ORF Transcript_125600/g.349746 Transcript_125600/m.349746 type:complete len:216 (-) Transcript_125600:1998-2645(-)